MDCRYERVTSCSFGGPQRLFIYTALGPGLILNLKSEPESSLFVRLTGDAFTDVTAGSSNSSDY